MAEEQRSDFRYFPFFSADQNPLKTVQEQTRESIRTKEYENLEGGDSNIRALCFAIENLTKPIKLVRPKVIFDLGRFPCYNDDNFEFVSLDSNSIGQCVAISHRWTDKDNRKNHLDVQWLKANWEKTDCSKMSDPLLFYDFTSLPQKVENHSRDGEDQLTFKAGLELIDHVFSHRTIVIPTSGYLFRYWCYVEFFIAAYNDSLLAGVPFVDPLPHDLAVLDKAIMLTHKVIMKPEFKEAVIGIVLIAQECGGIVSLGEKTTSDLVEFVFGLLEMKKTGKYGTMKIGLRRLIEKRAVVANMIRSRLRQCSLTVADDKVYLDTMLSHYLDKSAPELTDDRYEDWDHDAAVATINSAGEALAEDRKRKAITDLMPLPFEPK